MKLWRFMTPAKPLPLLVPTTSTSWPASKMSTASSWPSVYSAASAVRTSVRWRRGVTPAFSKWPVAGLFDLARVDRAVGDLDGGVAVDFSTERTWVTTFGEISTTVTGTSLLFSSQTWVMPSLVPSRPLVVLVADMGRSSAFVA